MSEYIIDMSESSYSSYPSSPLFIADDSQLHEEIVRCRDCKHFNYIILASYCKKSITTLCNPDGFCAWGERRSE